MYFTSKAFCYLRRIAFFDNLEASTFSSLTILISNYLFEKIRYRNGPHSLRHFRQDAVFMASCTASSSATLASQRAAEVSGNDESSGMLNRKMLFPESVNQEPPLACVFWFKSSGASVHPRHHLFLHSSRRVFLFYADFRWPRLLMLGRLRSEVVEFCVLHSEVLLLSSAHCIFR